MAEAILMPRLSETMTKAVVVKWHKSLGDLLKKGDLLAEIETDEATMELESYQEGYLLHIGCKEGETINVNEVLAIFGREGENIQGILKNYPSQPLNKTEISELNTRIQIRQDFYGVLGIVDEAKEMSHLISGLQSEQGMMVGLFGRWGRGKTFFWQHMWSCLDAEWEHFKKVEFQAWKFQDNPGTWAYLYEKLSEVYYQSNNEIPIFKSLQKIKKTVRLNYNRRGFLPLLKFAGILLLGVVSFLLLNELSKSQDDEIRKILTLVGLPLTAVTTIYHILKYLKTEFSSKASDLYTKYTKQHSYKDILGVQEEIQNEIIVLLKTWLPENKEGIINGKIVLFVDDIDRCTETKIIQIIDSLRVMLDEEEIAKRIVVITAVDERILKMAILNKYYDILNRDFDKTTEIKKANSEVLVREYMDKLFIAGIKLKPLTSNERIEILDSITEGKIRFKVNLEGIQELAAPPKNAIQIQSSIRLSDLKPINFEIDEQEYQNLKKAIEKNIILTPRNIRIIYYRYLLGKRFIKCHLHSYLKDGDWETASVKNTLAFLIVHYSAIGTPDNIYLDFAEHLSNTSDILSVSVLNETFELKNKVFVELLKIVSTVVPY
jgi:hypothetical protein